MSGLATRLYNGEAGIDIVGRRRIWYIASLVFVVLAIASFVFRGFHLGIEFEGGNSFQVPRADVSLEQVEDAASDTGAVVVSGQKVGGGGGGQYLIRTEELTPDEAADVKAAIADRAGVPSDQVSDNRVSASWGGQITRQALIALGVYLVLVVLYLAFRYEWKMAVGAFVALAHDLLIAAGVYSLVGFEVTPSTIIGLLTILGYSLYDTVVVFDKVQENTRGILGGARFTYGESANLAVNQTLMRSINTSLVALLPVGGLLFIGAGLLGAGTLKDLGLVLFVGMAAGAYSSIFLATPVVVDLKEREPRYAALRERVQQRRATGRDVPARRKSLAKAGASAGKSAAVPSEPADVVSDAVVDEPPATERSEATVGATGAAPRPGARPRSGAQRSGGGRSGQRKRGGRSGGKRKR